MQNSIYQEDNSKDKKETARDKQKNKRKKKEDKVKRIKEKRNINNSLFRPTQSSNLKFKKMK